MMILTFVLASLIGMAIKLKQKNTSLKDIAEKGNFEFPDIKAFVWENRSSIIWTLLGVAVFQVIFGKASINIINNASNVPEPFFGGWLIISRRDLTTAFISTLYLTIAYMGQDFVFAALSRTSKNLRSAIDYKTTIADTDKETGKVQPPTPTTPVK